MKVVNFGFYLPVLLIVFFGFPSTCVSGQDLDPIRWTIVKQVSPVKSGEVFKIEVAAAIDDGWHLYSLEQPAGGPIPTRITLPDDQKFKLAGDIETPLPQVVFDPNFNMDTQFYEAKAVFILPIEAVKNAPEGKNKLFVNALYQTCNDRTCLPPKSVKLTTDIEVTGGTQSTDSAKPVSLPTDEPVLSSTKKNDPVGIEFDFVDFTGKKRKISEFRGKYVLLDFWATWCRPCLADIPKLKELYEKHKASGFEIVGMGSETLGDESESPDPEFARETAERARKIVASRGVTWTQATTETAVPVANKIFNVEVLPTKILLDKEGRIIATIGEKDDLTGILEKLLTEKK